MAQQLVEGRTGTLPDGRRVIVRGGQIVPLETPGARLLPTERASGDRRSEEAYWGRRRTQTDPAVTQAEQGVSASRRAEGLIARQEAQGEGTGGIYGVPIIGPIAGYLDPEIRELNALQARQARLERQPGEGAISDFDAAQFVSMTYGADKPTETNRALIQAQRVVNDATLQKREFDEWYFNQYGTTVGSQEAWRVYAQENPIFDPGAQQQGQSARLNPNRQNWRQYFTGEQGLDTQAQIDAGASMGPQRVGPTTANGLPSYPTIEALQEGVTEIPISGGPGANRDQAIDILDPSVNVQDLPRLLAAGGWIRRGDEEPYYVQPNTVTTGTPESGAQQVRPGLFQGAQNAIDQRRNDEGLVRRADAFVGGIADAVTFGTIDEISAGLNTVLPLDRGSVGGWTKGFGPAYRQNLDLYRGNVQADVEQMPITRGAGQVTGSLVGAGGAARLAPQALRLAPRVAGATRGANTARIAANAGRLAVGGGATGGAYGFGSSEGNLQERAGNALEGAAVGAVAAPAVNALAQPVIRAVTPIGSAIARPAVALAERLNVPGAANLSQRLAPNPLASAADRYNARFNPDTNALLARADELEALGVQPAFIDTVDDARLGTFRAINTRDTPAREAGTRLAETRRRNLPSRVRNMADQEVSIETRPTLEVIEDLANTRRTNAGTGMASFGNQVVQLDENAIQAVRSDLVRTALRDAALRAQSSLDPLERSGAGRLAQIVDTALDNPAGAQLTIREAQDISAALNAAADGAFRSNTPANGPVLQALARAIRQSAKDQSDDYRAWLTQYADDSQLMEAATTGRNFVQASTDPVSGRSTDAFVRQAQQATPPELAVQRAAARQAMEAQGAGPTGARSVLEGFASNEDQYRRAAALGLDPARLRARSDAELRMVQNAQNVSPRVGSQTGTNVADQAAEIGGTARDVMTGNVPGLVGRLGRRIMSRGFSDAQAEAIGLAALDPSRTREVIELLATRMNRQEARSLLRALRFAASRGAGENAGDEN